MLFGFLPTVPFNERFQRLEQFTEQDVRTLLSVVNRLSLIGLAFLGVAITGSSYLITLIVFGPSAARIACVVVAAAASGAWLVLPIASRARDRLHERPSVA